uniref:serine hydrolase domain-containing protein n=2 Tax=Flavobacterium sp. TaxID=239 RepID=UPI0040492B4D
MNKNILIGFLLLNVCVLFAQKSKTELLDSLFTALEAKKAFNGNVLIAEQGNVIFEKSYGLADEATKRPLNATTIFELASVSKQFTAMGIVLLQKKGKLKYDDLVSKYIPELDFYGPITVRHLLHHTGGLPDYMDLFENEWDKAKFATNQDIVNLFAKQKPKAVFAPNEKFEYSNTGYALLGLIIEKVSKKSFGDYLNEAIFKPLKMKNTFVYRSRFAPQKIENYALGYVDDGMGNKVLTDSFGKEFYTYYLDGIVGDGMVNSNAGDLLIWDRALYANQLVDEKDKVLLFNGTKTNDGEMTKYGFGWIVLDHDKYGKVANHSGGWAGYTTFIERQLTHDKTIILLQNNSTSYTKIPSTEVRKILHGEKLESKQLKPIVHQEADLKQYLGTYANAEFPLKLTVFQEGTTLMVQATGQGAIPMDAYEGHIFQFEPANVNLVFDIEEHTVLLTQGGMKVNFSRE